MGILIFEIDNRARSNSNKANQTEDLSMLSYLKQGTILEFEQGNKHSYGILITADCDIFQNKFGKNLAFLPVISHYDYISDHWRHDQIQKEVIKIDNYLSEIGVGKLEAADVEHLIIDIGLDEFIKRISAYTSRTVDRKRFDKYETLINSNNFTELMRNYYK